MPIRWVALTGTPGVGKSTVAANLRSLGFTVVDGKRFARNHRCLVGVDAQRRTQIVEPRYVGRALGKEFPDDGRVRVLESHWAHDVPGVDAAIVLRLKPSIMAKRLKARRWSRAKVRENLEAEALHIIFHECLTRLGEERTGELDMTGRDALGAARKIARVLRDPEHRLTNLEIGRVDWTQEILRWY